MLPTLLSIGNLVLGFSAIAVIIQPAAFRPLEPPLEAAVWLIVAAGILDAIDGPLARRGGRVTPWGAELDALADLVSFGVAPVVLLGVSAPAGNQGVFAIAGAVFVLAGTWRLARFLWAGGQVREGCFTGLPSTAAGLAITAFWLFEQAGWGGVVHLWPGVIGTVVLSALMVSRIRYEKFPELGERGTRNRVKWVITGIAVAAIIVDPPRMGLTVAVLYAGYGPLAALFRPAGPIGSGSKTADAEGGTEGG